MNEKTPASEGLVYCAFLAGLSVLLVASLMLLDAHDATRRDMNERICTIYAEQHWTLPDYCDWDDLTEGARRLLPDAEYRRLQGR